MEGTTITYTVSSNESGLTMKSFLRQRKGISRKLLVRMKQEQSIFLNGIFTYLDHPITVGDVITMKMPEEESENIVPEAMKLDIQFEDEDIMVLNKPANQCVHPTLLHPNGTLANGVVHYWMEQGFNRKFRAVNRLDKNTTGLLIVAKNQYAHQQLAITQRERQLTRVYEALVHGKLNKEEGTIQAPIARKSESLVEREVREDGQDAITHFKVLQELQNASYVQLKLETGRTHQIRVHMSYIGHPLLGDDLYGGTKEWMDRQALHARYLSFPHPRSKKIMSFTSELPADMEKTLNELLF
ncbi:RluA family pseudouridine synthase [Ammoniphilus resinae]|uniref:Pseudouridine synthase n=1 Tax=Ammoniphilus resinae TaxID=861532 RepID=A0ABS4GRH8_9BACL|nr:RluA family pseudouridine synthase [Ammoniphilus resinae]MBP1932866.1 23S rRNA pseudouridine1911/1915/1917 synthase [Ammoniphilus resinae]